MGTYSLLSDKECLTSHLTINLNEESLLSMMRLGPLIHIVPIVVITIQFFGMEMMDGVQEILKKLSNEGTLIDFRL